MILDTSALLAILFDEPDRISLLDRMLAAPLVAVGAPTLVEASVVCAARMGEGGIGALEGLIARLGAVVIPFGPAHRQVAAQAWLRYGRGRHPAALNLGDCMAYATARVAGLPLLCKGDDFPATDLVLA